MKIVEHFQEGAADPNCIAMLLTNVCFLVQRAQLSNGTEIPTGLFTSYVMHFSFSFDHPPDGL